MIVFLLPILLTLSLLTPKEALAEVGSWQKGVTIDPTSPTCYSGDDFRESMTNLKTTGTNFVSLIIPYYQSSVGSTDLAPGWNTPTDQSLIDGVSTIHSLGMKVMLKMHPEVKDGNWRGAINPDDRAGWFQTYGDILEHYSSLAQQNGVEEICLGAEMFNLTSSSVNATNTENWNKLIDRVKSKFSGSLTYSAQHTYPREAEEIEFWNRLDYIGFAAYWALAAGDPNPSPETLKNAWSEINGQAVSPLSQRWGKPVLFTEIGYRSLAGAHADPWDWGRSGAADETEQARDYEALFSYWNSQSFMNGVFLWKWEASPNAGGSGDTGYTPQNKQAQGVMSQWFGGQAVPTPEPTPTGAEPTPTGSEPTPTGTEPTPTSVEPTPTGIEPTPTEIEPTPGDLTPTPTQEPDGGPTATPTPTSEPEPTDTPAEPTPEPPAPTEIPATPTEEPPAPTPTATPTPRFPRIIINWPKKDFWRSWFILRSLLLRKAFCWQASQNQKRPFKMCADLSELNLGKDSPHLVHLTAQDADQKIIDETVVEFVISSH